MAKPSRKQLLDDLKKALSREKKGDRASFLRGWKQVDRYYRKNRTYD